MNVQEMVLRRTIPVVINSYNQLTYLKNLIQKFIENKFTNIYVVDQCSTFPPLCSFLSTINQNCPQVFPIYSDKNNGPRWFIENSVYHMFAAECFIYSDPDIIFDRLADDFVFRFLQLSHKYRVAKVGSALSLHNLNNSVLNVDGKLYSAYEWESQFWRAKAEEDVYNAPVDTTLHLFNKQYYSPVAFFKAIRVGGQGYEVQHTPWLINDPMPLAERNYYTSASRENGWSHLS
ncbi:glycosyltransferase family A protein [Rhodoferax fermentans]|uniref:glycosyltransferase family A protein n=1 Tax=Rhodoferax fermentans TaxID=28066 RepID=UPI001179F2C2|nr:glycosyltransferase family A protein [Rhodoferax fermentans]